MKYIDLFAGVGGFRYGIEKAVKLVEDTTNKVSKSGKSEFEINGWEWKHATCVYSNEWDKYANSVYKKHYKECDDRDIRTVKSSEIPDFDLLCGGFPCQSFSVAGKRGGFDDTRGTLFFEIARILTDKRPRYFILENVKGLLSHDSGKTFQTIIGVLADIGYGVQWQVLNSKDFGVPQNRERVFIVGHLRGTSRPEVFPITGSNSKTPEQIIGGSQGNRLYKDSGTSVTIASQAGGQGAKTGLYSVINPKMLNYKGSDKHSVAITATSYKEPSVVMPDKHGIYDGMAIRRLTPIECERLQGFPDNWTQFGLNPNDDEVDEIELIKISDSQRYKMMGNAVTTNVVGAVVERLLK